MREQVSFLSVTTGHMRIAASSEERTESAAVDHVCIVDDDQEVRSLLSTYLTRNGLRVGAFEDGPS